MVEWLRLLWGRTLSTTSSPVVLVPLVLVQSLALALVGSTAATAATRTPLTTDLEGLTRLPTGARTPLAAILPIALE